MRLSCSSRYLAWVLAAALCAAAGGPAPASAADTIVTDAGGRQVRIADASRFLSVGGDITAIVYALQDGLLSAAYGCAVFAGRTPGRNHPFVLPPAVFLPQRNIGARPVPSPGLGPCIHRLE